MRMGLLARAVMLGCVLASSSPGWARGQLQARPTLVEIAPGATAGRMTLANTGDMPVAAEVRAFAWSQRDGEDRLSETHELALSPVIVKIPPGGEQIVRIVRLGPPPAGQDQTYRVVVDELPGKPVDAVQGINFRMRYVLPVYVHDAKATLAAVRCSLSAAILACENTGGRAAQLGDSQLRDASGHSVELSPGLFGYVLPGSRRQWPLVSASLSTLTAGLRLETQLNGQPVAIPVSRTP